MFIPTFDPNKDLVDPDTIPGIQQARTVETVALSLDGACAFDADWAGVLLLQPPKQDDFLFSFVHLKCSDLDHPLLAIEQEHPQGNWGVMVAANMSMHSGGESLVDYLRSAALLGAFPENVTKVAVFPSFFKKPWHGGLRLLNENGVFLVSDYAEALVAARHDPVGAARGFVRTNSLRYEPTVMSEKTAEMLGDDLVQAIAIIEAHELSRAVKGHGYADMKAYTKALSLGELVWPAPLKRLSDGRPDFPSIPPSARTISGLPPIDHPARKITDVGQKTDMLHRAWNAYLQRYGVRLNPEKAIFDLDPFRCSEMDDLVFRICAGDDIDAEYVDHMAACLGNPRLAASVEGCSFDGRVWMTPESVHRQNRVSPTGNPHTPSSAIARTIEQAIAHLGLCLAESGGDPHGRKHAGYMLVDGTKSFTCHDYPDEVAAMAKGSRWKVITAQNGFAARMPIEACAVAAGLIDLDDVDVIATINCDFKTIGADKAREALSVLEEAGIEHVCDVGGTFADLPDLCDFVREMRTSPNPRRDPSLRLIPELADPKFLSFMEEQAKATLACENSKKISKALNTVDPDRAETALSLLSGKTVELPREWEVPLDTFDCDLLKALDPLEDFYPQYVAETSGLVDIVDTWKTVLEDAGFSLSIGFPVGVDPDLFGKTREVFGVSSYLEVLEAGIPFEDLFPDVDRSQRLF